MNKQVLKVLLVEDDEEDFLIVRDILSKTRVTRFELVWAPTYEAGLERIEREEFSALLVDYNLHTHTGLEFIREVSERGSQVPIIMLTGHDNYEIDLRTMQAGAADFLTKKDVNAPLLERSIRYAIEHKQIERKLRNDAVRAELLANLTRDFTEAGFDAIGMVNNITRRISETFGDAIILRILAKDEKTLEPAAIYHPDPQVRAFMVELLSNNTQLVGEGLVGEVAQTQEPRMLCNTSLSELLTATKMEYKAWYEQNPVDCIFSVPLCSHTRLIGTLSVVRNAPNGEISAEDQAFYLDLGNRAAMAIENARLHQEVQHLAVTDSLTGMLNRRGFAQLAQRELERSLRFDASLSVVMLDIDHFKNANDTYGHTFGDEVLKALSETCTTNVRKMDIAGRFGGDEFIILLPETDLAAAKKVAQRIHGSFARTSFYPEGEEVRMTVSLGVTRVSEETKDLDTLIKRVDAVLYQSKQKGRNRVEVL
jgi:diguanylate cyclase (GGDEF)-like protein